MDNERYLDVNAYIDNPILKDIIKAILYHFEIRYKYPSSKNPAELIERTVQPQCLGIDKARKFKLRGYQVSPTPKENRLFTIPGNGLIDLVLTDQPFNSPGPKFKKGDSAMEKIICELNFDNVPQLM